MSNVVGNFYNENVNVSKDLLQLDFIHQWNGKKIVLMAKLKFLNSQIFGVADGWDQKTIILGHI